VSPPLLFLIGQLGFYIIPPILQPETLNYELLIFDLVALAAFLLSYLIFFFITPFKKSKPGLYHVNNEIRLFNSYLLALLLVIYYIRIYLWNKFGIISITHAYAYDGGLIDIVKSTVIGVLIAALFYGLIVYKKNIYIIFLLPEILLKFSQFSKVVVVTFVIIYFMVYVLAGKLTMKKLNKFLIIILPISFIITIYYASLTSIYRGVSVNKNPTIEDFQNIEFRATDKGKIFSRLLDRFNLHKNHKYLDGVEEFAAKLELESLYQIYLRVTFQIFKLNPLPYWGNKLEYLGSDGVMRRGIGKSANVFPRNIILYEIGGFSLIIAFAILNALYIYIFGIITLNIMNKWVGISIYVPFAMGYLLADGGANIAVTIFNQIMLILSIVIIILTYYLLVSFKIIILNLFMKKNIVDNS